jgi:signal transduction histidine kinase
VGFSDSKRTSRAVQPVPARVWAAFGLLMQIRMLTAAITLLLLPDYQLKAQVFVLVLCIAVLSWLAANHWQLIVPRLLHHPLLVVTDICLTFLVLGIGGPSGPFFLTTVITAAVAGLLYRWPGMLSVSFLLVLGYYAALGYALQKQAASTTTFQAIVGQPVYYPLVGFAGVALRRLFDDQAAQEQALRHAEVVAAAAEERTRLAREMHDSLAKTLRGIALSAAALPTWIRREPGRAAEEAQRIVAGVEIASRESRVLISGLRDDTVTKPLPEAVRETTAAWGAEYGISVACDIEAAADLPLRHRYESLAILSEALTNIERHAAARSVHVKLAMEPGEVVLVVRDDGRGFRSDGAIGALTQAGHYGLAGLHERAERIGGTVSVTSEPGAGTSVTARLPLATSVDLPLAEVS